jgi:predicted membrane-bound spermidine synthase
MTGGGLHTRVAVRPLAALLVVADVATLGFITLGFEMVASRILTPLFGGDIYTWATIISIVVAGLMTGYFIGGPAADRAPNFAFAAAIKFGAAIYIGVVWALIGGGLESFLSGITDDTAARFVGGVIVCFPPLVILGMYSPLAVRLLLRDPDDAGTISGGLFAISSAGNIAGTLVTTFTLIPAIGTRAITGAFAVFLVFSGLVSLAAWLSRQR